MLWSGTVRGTCRQQQRQRLPNEPGRGEFTAIQLCDRRYTNRRVTCQSTLWQERPWLICARAHRASSPAYINKRWNNKRWNYCSMDAFHAVTNRITAALLF